MNVTEGRFFCYTDSGDVTKEPSLCYALAAFIEPLFEGVTGNAALNSGIQ